jgi:S-adenosylmethionine decarboxylase
MKNLAPAVFRQRLLIEATYARTIGRSDVEDFLRRLPAELGLRIYSEPVVYSPGGEGQPINQGYDGFVALIDSGISVYVWENAKFLSAVIYTCKRFDPDRALAFTREFFSTRELEHFQF